MADTDFEHDAANSRYLLRREGELVGEAVYRDTGDGRIFVHSEIAPHLQHQGLGTRLVRAALDDTRSAGLKPIAQCSMVRNFLAEHPDYASAPRT